MDAMNVMVMLTLLSTVMMGRGDATQVDMPMLSNGVAASHNLCESFLSSGMKEDDAGEGVTLHTSFETPPILNDADTVWPALELNWRVTVGSIIAFLGGSLGCAGGIGGGGIFVPLLVLVIGFDEKSSTALSKCMIMGASAASVCYQLTLKSATVDYDLALIFQPVLVLGISIGVVFNVIFPNWIVTILLLVLFTGTSFKTLQRAIVFYKRETIEKTLAKEGKSALYVALEAGLETEQCVATPPALEPAPDLVNSIYMTRGWKSVAALGYVWISFLALQILKNYSAICSSYYWVWSILQVPVAASVFFTTAIRLYVRNKKSGGEDVEESLVATRAAHEIKWTIPTLCLCAAAGLLAGTVGGLLGLGGGFILGPLFLELGVPPEVASATATFVMLFSSSMSVIEYHLLHRFPVPFALYLFAINAAAGFWAQVVLRKIINLCGRASIIIFVLSFVIFVSAICLGGYGIQDSITRLENKEYMGFLNLCTSS